MNLNDTKRNKMLRHLYSILLTMYFRFIIVLQLGKLGFTIKGFLYESLSLLLGVGWFGVKLIERHGMETGPSSHRVHTNH